MVAKPPLLVFNFDVKLCISGKQNSIFPLPGPCHAFISHRNNPEQIVYWNSDNFHLFYCWSNSIHASSRHFASTHLQMPVRSQSKKSKLSCLKSLTTSKKSAYVFYSSFGMKQHQTHWVYIVKSNLKSQFRCNSSLTVWHKMAASCSSLFITAHAWWPRTSLSRNAGKIYQFIL